MPGYALLGRILERLGDYGEAERALRKTVELAEGRRSAAAASFSALRTRGSARSTGSRRGREEARRAPLASGESTLGKNARGLPRAAGAGRAARLLGRCPNRCMSSNARAPLSPPIAATSAPWLVDYYRDLGARRPTSGPGDAEHTLAAGLDIRGRSDPGCRTRVAAAQHS